MSILNPPTQPLINPRQPEIIPQNVVWLTIISVTAGTGTLAAVGYLFLAVRDQDWPFILLAGLFALVGLTSVPALLGARTGIISNRQLGLVSGLLALAGIGQAVFIKGAGLPTAIIYLIFSLIVTSSLSMKFSGSMTILGGLFSSALMSLMATFSPYAVLQVNAINLILPSLLAIVLMTYITMLTVQYISSTLQIRLTTAFIAIVIVSLSIATLVQSQVTISELRTNTSNNVILTASQVATNLDNFIETNLNAVQQEAQVEPIIRFLEVHRTGQVDDAALNDLKMVFRLLQYRETDERLYLSSYALLDETGKNIFDTTESNVGLQEGNQLYFSGPYKNNKAYVSDVLFSAEGYSYVYFSAPVLDNLRQPIGVLRVRYNALVFQRLLETYSGLLGRQSHAMLFDENSLRLADTFTPDMVYSTVLKLPADAAVQLTTERRLPTRPDAQKSANNPELARALGNSDRSASFSANLEPENFEQANPLNEIGGIAKLSQKSWKVVYLQANFDDTPIRDGQVRIATLIATLIAVLVGFVSVGLSNLLSSPIKSLTGTAERISEGDFNARSKVLGNDEFGTLGRAFNQMTDQLRTFINELEDRVLQRTREIAKRNDDLTYRSRQLQTVADVARSIVTTQDLQPLLDSVTHLISDRFNFYHVGIFLLDENREFAVLRAANSEGGQHMLARNHMLRVGKVGIVGYVTSAGEPRIATDVGADSVFFNNPDLPITRSEMALPLKVGDQVIGAMDVQSTESNAFTPDDIELFTTLADQVAIAIHNNRLFAETTRALLESQNLHRQYLRQEWDSELVTGQKRTYQYTPRGTTASEMEIPEAKNILTTGEPYATTEEQPDHTSRAVMVVPILLRGETIGVIRVQDSGVNRSWTEDEFQSVKDIAQQVGVALEAARLLEKTVRRAEREKKVLEISGMIRSTNDPQQMLEIAASELQKALGASRAQIFIRRTTSPLKEPHNGGNGQQEN